MPLSPSFDKAFAINTMFSDCLFFSLQLTPNRKSKHCLLAQKFDVPSEFSPQPGMIYV